MRSTAKMKNYNSPLHIISARLSELGIAFAAKSVEVKSNETPAVRKLIEELDIEGCMVVADALNCQKETAAAIVEAKGDCLLDAKENQPLLEQEIKEYVQDTSQRKKVEITSSAGKNRNRIETHTTYLAMNIDWLYGKEK